MQVSKELFAKINTLPWQALYEYSMSRGIKEEELKNKDKAQIIKILDVKNLMIEKEIDRLIEDYIYGNRVSFSLWRFDEKITNEDIDILKKLEGKEINCGISEYRSIKIQKVTKYGNRIELIYTYSKIYNYINELGKADSVWEQHQGCSWVGLDKFYVAYIVKHEKMTKIFANALTQELHKNIAQIKPPLSALDRIFYDSVMSKIVLQGVAGEKTAISRSEGFTDEQKEEVKRIKKNRFNMSGSYITPICDKTVATVRYNVKKGNISILKHLSSKELFVWTEGAINIIFEEIDKLKGKDAKKIFEELGQEIKWSLIALADYPKMNWLLTQVISNLNEEQSIEIPANSKDILDNDKLFIKLLRPYCEKCDSYEVALCSECGRVIKKFDTNYFCECGSKIKALCGEGHKLSLDKYWYVPTNYCLEMINKNIKKVYPDNDLNYLFCIIEDTLIISRKDIKAGGEILFEEIEEFACENFEIDKELIDYALGMGEKCDGTCSYEKIEKCLENNEQVCLPKLFYKIIPGFRPQPHKGTEYGDISGRIKSNGNEYEMKGIIKRNVSKSFNKQNIILLSTSSQGQEIIRQFVEQGMSDGRCELILVVVPQILDNSFKGTLRFLARLSNKKVTFIELEGVCKLLKKAGIK